MDKFHVWDTGGITRVTGVTRGDRTEGGEEGNGEGGERGKEGEGGGEILAHGQTDGRANQR